MKPVTIYSWNVNGIRSAYRKGFMQWLEKTQPDILCIQESRVSEAQRGHTYDHPLGYYTYWNDADKLGYSGTALLTKTPPISLKTGIFGNDYDPEGRTQLIEYEDFLLINCYFPNGSSGPHRLEAKLKFYDEFLGELKNKAKPVIICADVNTAHTEIDLANPQANRGRSGFLPKERDWINKLLSQGYVDTLRAANPEKEGLYTWWSMRQGVKEKNSGWRFDYIYVPNDLAENVARAFTEPEVNASDHCPIGIELANCKLNDTDVKFLPNSQQTSMF